MATRKTEIPAITIPHRFGPRSYQREIFEARDENPALDRFLSVIHRKGGKDLSYWNFTIREAWKIAGMYWYTFPTLEQGKLVLWEGTSVDAQFGADGRLISQPVKFLDHVPRALVEKINLSEHTIKLKNGSIIKLLGTKDLDTIVGPNPRGVVFSEFSVQHPAAWQRVVSPILEQNGGWAAFNFTPRGTNHAFDLLQMAQRNRHRWFVQVKTIDDTRRDAPGENGSYVISPERIAQLRREGVDERFIQAEYYCQFHGGKVGSYYGDRMQEIQQPERLQVRAVPHEPLAPVFTVEDLGRGDANATWFFQWVGAHLHAIEYDERTGWGIPERVAFLKARALPPGTITTVAGIPVEGRSYFYSNHWAPFDMNVTELSTNKKRVDAARELGIRYRIVPKLSIDEGIDAARRLIPITHFDRENCRQGIRCLENYARKVKSEVEGTFYDEPAHDEWSHGADAYRYAALIAYQNSADYLMPVRVEREFDVFAQDASRDSLNLEE